MSNDSEEFKVGDSVLVVDTDHDGALGTIIGVAAGPDGLRYLVVFENGKQRVFNAKNLSHRR
jgi:CO dehydrogenase nickel-insertion accessory protein CooC1